MNKSINSALERACGQLQTAGERERELSSLALPPASVSSTASLPRSSIGITSTPYQQPARNGTKNGRQKYGFATQHGRRSDDRHHVRQRGLVSPTRTREQIRPPRRYDRMPQLQGSGFPDIDGTQPARTP